MFRDVAARRPNLLSRVRMLLIELHITPAFGMTNGSELSAFLHHVIDAHGFQLYRRRFNGGWKQHQKQVLEELQRMGVPLHPCCVELHFVRPEDAGVPSAAPEPPSEPDGSHTGSGRSTHSPRVTAGAHTSRPLEQEQPRACDFGTRRDPTRPPFSAASLVARTMIAERPALYSHLEHWGDARVLLGGQRAPRGQSPVQQPEA